jgi:hypothetical protein
MEKDNGVDSAFAVLDHDIANIMKFLLTGLPKVLTTLALALITASCRISRALVI